MKKLVAESLNEFKAIPSEKPLFKGEKKIGVSLKDIDPKNQKNVEKEFLVGLEVEKEHSSDIAVRRAIALQHLVENPKYYSEGMKKGIFDEPAAINLYKKYFIDKEETSDEDRKNLSQPTGESSELKF